MAFQRDVAPACLGVPKSKKCDQLPDPDETEVTMMETTTETTSQIEQHPSDHARQKRARVGIQVSRYFTKADRHPYEEVAWELRDAVIRGQDGTDIFRQDQVEVPTTWSQTATNIVAQKYFRGAMDSNERESSVKRLFDRVVDTITEWGKQQGYFRSEQDAEIFNWELKHLLVHQKAAFNSPVWFNVGVDEHPQCSACFINSVDDTMDSILKLVHTEGMLFKWGSGTGTNLSTLRSSKETLAGGGTASGPVSFMKGYDAFAGVIKSGGKTRRAAKMVILNVDHPDIMDFIKSKAREEKKAWALIQAGYDGSFEGEAYSSVFFQNANNSVRVTDEFMKALENDADWHTRAVTDGHIVDTYRAKSIMRAIAEAAHQCGDPGLQFDTTVNKWNTCPNSGWINGSNPCSEFMFLDNSACNLASLNLRRFQAEDGELDIQSFNRAVDLMTLAQEIIVDNARYPTPEITENSKRFRPLGLGYANLGALLMSRGLPYDSEPGRAYAAAVTALMTGRAYLQSARIAATATGPFDEFDKNAEPFLKVISNHRTALDKVDAALVPYELMQAAREAWSAAYEEGRVHGFRNAQVTLLAPTGTIGFLMDCDTTGIEPDIALVKYKQLVGGGSMKLVNGSIRPALRRLGYNEAEVANIQNYMEEHDTIEGAPHIKEEHLPVFDCALRPRNGVRSIHYMGHVKMMAAVQPFLSGAISKTVNLPEDVTVEDIEDVYTQAWKLGLKAVAIYRDGSKLTQPVTLDAKTTKTASKPSQKTETVYKPVRHKLPQDRMSVTHKFEVAGHEGYLTVGYYDNGAPGEIFIKMAKEGSTISGLMDSFATAISVALQYGVPLKLFCDKFIHSRFEPSGFTNNKEIPMASSLMDYIFTWLERHHLKSPEHPLAEKLAPILNGSAAKLKNPNFDAKVMADVETTAQALMIQLNEDQDATIESELETYVRESDAPACPVCGFIMVRNGSCHKCENCGATSGCS